MRFLLSIALLALTSTSFADGRHINATNCEIFIDKIEVSIGSHGSAVIKPFIKLIPSRLNGQVAEVGFRNSRDEFSYSTRSRSTTPWMNEILESRSPVRDYFVPGWGFMVISDFGNATITGSFYVRTTTGTTYWAKNGNGGDFVFDYNAFTLLRSYGSHDSYGYSSTVRTQRADMRYYNAKNCY